MSEESVDLSPAQLLDGVQKNLRHRFFERSKSKAKSDYGDLEAGTAIPFMTISADGNADIACKLSLDHSEFIGKLTFARFRQSLTALLLRLAETLKHGGDLNMLTEQTTGDLVFYVPGITDDDDVINALVVGIQQRSAGEVTAQLMFLNPENLDIRKRN